MWPSLLVVLLGISPSAVADASPHAATSLPALAAPAPAPALPTLLPDTLPALPSAQPGARPQAAPAQPPQAADLARATAREVATLAAIERERAQALAEKTRLARQYEGELQEIDRLKRQRASWRRDRLIRDQLRASHDTARALAAADQRVRRLDASLATQRGRLVAAIDRELAAAPTVERRSALARWRAGAQREQRRDVKKIVLPDERMDPLADPEELEDHAALLRQSEVELAKELARLEQQADRYRYMVTLSTKRERAAELGRLDDDQPRRTSVRSGAGSASGDVHEEAPPAPPAPPSPPSPPGEDLPGEDPPDDRGPDPQPVPDTGDDADGALTGLDVVLADVVDTSTLDALRAADRSANPAVKARAAERASAQVRARLERLRAQRKRIQVRAQELRTE
jgi:hypothetical protein